MGADSMSTFAPPAAVNNVPLVDITRQYREIRQEIEEAFHSVLEQGACVGPPFVPQFEARFATYVGAEYCVSVSSGTSSLELTLRAAGVGKGDEVILPANTFIASAEAVLFCGAKPVFADICEDSYNLDPEEVERQITRRTKAVIVVDLYGQPADLDQISDIAARHKIIVIEDAAQAHGATYGGRLVGAISYASCFSFYPTKNLGAYGEGGAVTTNDPQLANRIALLANHGSRTKYVHEIVGHNHRMHALQAAVLSVKLCHLDQWIARRRQIASRYDEGLKDSPTIVTPRETPGRQHSYHLYVVRVENRPKIQDSLATAGVTTGIHYPVPLHLQKSLAFLGYRRGAFPRSESCAVGIMSLPIFPELLSREVDCVIECLLDAVSRS